MTFVNSTFYLESDKLLLFQNHKGKKGKGREAEHSLWSRGKIHSRKNASFTKVLNSNFTISYFKALATQ